MSHIEGEPVLKADWLDALLNGYRMNQTMESLKKLDESRYTTLIRVLFGLDSPSPVSLDPVEMTDRVGQLEFYDPTLNDSQKDAIRFALLSREVALIHGPPGVCSSRHSFQTRSCSYRTDWKDIHSYRANLATRKTKISHIGLWAFKYLC